MISTYLNKILWFKKAKDKHYDNISKNIIIVFVSKFGSAFINFLLIPITLNYVGSEKYGIWITISSIFLWINFFDLGLGNGLRNSLTISLTKKDYNKARRLIGATYASLTIISILFIIIFFLTFDYINLNNLFKLSSTILEEVVYLTKVVIILSCVQFVLQLINSILFAIQKSGTVSLTIFLGDILNLIFIVVVKHHSNSNLILLALCYFLGSIISKLIISIYIFYTEENIKPKFGIMSFNELKMIFNSGGRFFVIQVAALIQFQTANVLISRYLSVSDVTEYNISFKLFSIITMLFVIVTTPIWSAITEANTNNDINWIIETKNKIFKAWLYFVLFSIILFIFSPYIYEIWIGKRVNISILTSLGCMMYVISITFGSIYVTILNGLGKTKIQFYLSIFTIVMFLPMAYYLINEMKLGILGINIAMVLININGLIAAPLEYNNFIKTSLLKSVK